jgi:hypothetical protein
MADSNKSQSPPNTASSSVKQQHRKKLRRSSSWASPYCSALSRVKNHRMHLASGGLSTTKLAKVVDEFEYAKQEQQQSELGSQKKILIGVDLSLDKEYKRQKEKLRQKEKRAEVFVKTRHIYNNNDEQLHTTKATEANNSGSTKKSHHPEDENDENSAAKSKETNEDKIRTQTAAKPISNKRFGANILNNIKNAFKSVVGGYKRPPTTTANTATQKTIVTTTSTILTTTTVTTTTIESSNESKSPAIKRAKMLAHRATFKEVNEHARKLNEKQTLLNAEGLTRSNSVTHLDAQKAHNRFQQNRHLQHSRQQQQHQLSAQVKSTNGNELITSAAAESIWCKSLRKQDSVSSCHSSSAAAVHGALANSNLNKHFSVSNHSIGRPMEDKGCAYALDNCVKSAHVSSKPIFKVSKIKYDDRYLFDSVNMLCICLLLSRKKNHKNQFA